MTKAGSLTLAVSAIVLLALVALSFPFFLALESSLLLFLAIATGLCCLWLAITIFSPKE